MTKKTTVHTPVEKFNGEVVGVKFTDGVGKTDDPAALAYFHRHGYKVGEEQSDGGEEQSEERPSKAWTVDRLTAYAKEHDIALEGATLKDDILAKVEAHDLLA